MSDETDQSDQTGHRAADAPRPDRAASIQWYHPGQERTVNVDGVAVIVRFVERKGRRGRFAVNARR